MFDFKLLYLIATFLVPVELVAIANDPIAVFSFAVFRFYALYSNVVLLFPVEFVNKEPEPNDELLDSVVSFCWF